MNRGHSFSYEDLIREMEENEDWWKACVKCHFCPVFTKNCSFKKYSSTKEYFATCSIRAYNQR